MEIFPVDEAVVRRYFMKKVSFEKVIGKQLCRSLFLLKLQAKRDSGKKSTKEALLW